MRPKWVWVVLAGALAGLPSVGAQDGGDHADFVRLRQAYQERVKQDVTATQRKYLEALLALEKRLLAAKELDAVAAVREEYERVVRSDVYAPGHLPGDVQQRVETGEALEAFLPGTTWRVKGWDASKLVFLSEGKGMLGETDVKWKVVNERQVEIDLGEGEKDDDDDRGGRERRGAGRGGDFGGFASRFLNLRTVHLVFNLKLDGFNVPGDFRERSGELEPER